MPKLYGFRGSGNCLKVAYLLDHLGDDYEWVDVDIFAGESREPWFLRLNPTGQVPVLELGDGRTLSQSNAILLWLARDTHLVPADPWRLALVQQWLFWEQYSHEPNVAVCRADLLYRGKRPEQLDPAKVQRGNAALDQLERHLVGRDWLVDGGMSVADLSLVAYSRVAHEGGFDLSARPALRSWIDRVERTAGIGDGPRRALNADQGRNR